MANNIIALANARGSSAQTRAGARRWLLANLPLPAWDTASRATRFTRGAWQVQQYVEARRMERAERYCVALGLMPLDAAMSLANGIDRQIAADTRVALCYDEMYATPSGSWAGGDTTVSVSFTDSPFAVAETVRAWSDNRKWSGNNLSVRLGITRRTILSMGARNVIQGGLITLDAEQIGVREYRATWAEQHGKLGLKMVQGWIVRGYHSTARTLEQARKQAAKARAEQAAQAIIVRSKRRSEESTIRAAANVFVSVQDSLAAGNCLPGTDAVARVVRRELGGDVGAVRGDVLLSLVGAVDRQRAIRAIEAARINHGR
jgi:hypothetical protein